MMYFYIKPFLSCYSRILLNEATSSVKQFLHYQVSARLTQKFTSVLHPACRSYMTRTTEKTEDILRVKDKIPEGYTLVYRSGFDNYFYAVQIISAISVVIAPFALFYNVKTTGDLFGHYKLESVRMSDLDSYAMFVGFLLYNYLLLRVSYIRVFRFYSKDDSHILVRNKMIPSKFRKTEFVSGDLEVRKTKLPVVFARYRLKKSKVIISPNYFRTPHDLLIMLSSDDEYDEYGE